MATQVNTNGGEMKTVEFPKRPPGRPSDASKQDYDTQVETFIKMIVNVQDTLDFKMGIREWCYYMEENFRAIDKKDFDNAVSVMNQWRDEGRFPVGFIPVTEKGQFSCIEEESDLSTPKERAASVLDYVIESHEDYKPFSFWDYQDVYIQLVVEKTSLKSLFEKICRKYNVPIANLGGWSEKAQREELALRFKHHEELGRRPVLLYAGDFDPKGLQMSQNLKTNISQIHKMTGWSPTTLEIERFAISKEYILQFKPMRIDNLWTQSKTVKVPLEDPEHPDHPKDYVQEYLYDYCEKDGGSVLVKSKDGKLIEGPNVDGSWPTWKAWKVEGEAMVAHPEESREVCENAILDHLSVKGINNYYADTNKIQAQAATELKRFVSEGYLDDLLNQ